MKNIWQTQTGEKPHLSVLQALTDKHKADPEVDATCADYSRAVLIAAELKEEMDKYYFAEGLGYFLGVTTWYVVIYGTVDEVKSNALEWEVDGFHVLFDFRNNSIHPTVDVPSPLECNRPDAELNYN